MKHPLHIFPTARPRLAARQQTGTRHTEAPHPARDNSTRTATDIRMHPRVRRLAGLRHWTAALCCTAVLAGCATPTQNGAEADAAALSDVCLLAEGIAYGKSYWAVRWKKRRSVT